MFSLCPLFKAGVACCLPTCAQGSSVPVMVNMLCVALFGLFGISSVSCVFGGGEGVSLASHPVVYKAWVTLVCLLLDTPFGRRSVEALPLYPLGRMLNSS